MSFWRHFTRGLRVLGSRKAADQDIADEVSHYLDEATAAFVARHEDALFLGPPGTGKSHLAQAIGQAVSCNHQSP